MKSVLITGCSSGFGLELAKLLLERGWLVFATLRNASSRPEIFGDLPARYPDRLQIASLDVTNGSERAAVLAEIATRTGGTLDCLVNNAGLGLFGALEDVDDEQIRREMEVNFFGLTFLTREALPLLRAARGKIINLSSILGLMGAPLTSLYCASKFAVEGLSESLFHELRPYGVRVTLVEPGGHRTKFGPNVLWGARTQDPSSVYFGKTKRYRDELRAMLEKDATPMDGVVRKLAALAESSAPPLRVRCGKDAKLFYALRVILPDIIYRNLVSLGTKILYYRD